MSTWRPPPSRCPSGAPPRTPSSCSSASPCPTSRASQRSARRSRSWSVVPSWPRSPQQKLLRDHPRIVNFIEASFSELPATATRAKCYEIFILMEWCPGMATRSSFELIEAGGGIIDMMNTRLQNRMTESEILKIFSDVVEVRTPTLVKLYRLTRAQAVAHMHYQSPPLIHRDLKVSTSVHAVLSSLDLSRSRTSCSVRLRATSCATLGRPRRPSCASRPPSQRSRRWRPTSTRRPRCSIGRRNSWTSGVARALTRRLVGPSECFGSADEALDIWALGVFLYKLCYYTTPFEEAGPLAIINAQYKV